MEGTTTLALNQLNQKKLHTSHHHKMNKSTQTLQYWDMLWILLLKQKLVDFYTMVKQLYLYILPSINFTYLKSIIVFILP